MTTRSVTTAEKIFTAGSETGTFVRRRGFTVQTRKPDRPNVSVKLGADGKLVAAPAKPTEVPPHILEWRKQRERREKVGCACREIRGLLRAGKPAEARAVASNNSLPPGLCADLGLTPTAQPKRTNNLTPVELDARKRALARAMA